jgi:hypothetical protein
LTLSNGCADPVTFTLYSRTNPSLFFDLDVEWIPAFTTVNVAYPTPLVFSPSVGGTVLVAGSATGPTACVDVSAAGIQT